MSLQQLLESDPNAGSRVVGGGRVDVFGQTGILGQTGNWLRNNVFRTFDPVQEAARFRARQNTVPAQPQRRVSNLPPSARVPSQYPAGVPTGIGGGNAGASRAPAPVAQTQAPAPASQPQSSNWAPAAQQNPRLPAGRNVAIVNPRSQAQNRALDQAAQNAGLPAWNWKAAENKAVFDAAEARSQAATAAREAQGGRGYITADNLPAALDQSKAEYWQGADMQAWMNASEGNRKLAERAMARAGYNPRQRGLTGATAAAAAAPVAESGVMAGPEWSFSGAPTPTAAPLAAAAAKNLGYDMSRMGGPDFVAPAAAPSLNDLASRAAAPPAVDPRVLNGSEWSLTNSPSSAMAPMAAAAADMSSYGYNRMSGGPDFPMPVAAGQAPAPDFRAVDTSALPGGGQVIDDPAQARLQEYLQRLKNLNPTEWNFNRRVG